MRFIRRVWRARASRETAIVIVGNSLTVFGALATLSILTRVLPIEHYGTLALGLTVVTLVNQVIHGPIGNGIGRFAATAKELEQLEVFVHAAIRVAILSAVASIGALLILAPIGLSGATRVSFPLLVLCVVLAAISGTNSLGNALYAALRNRIVVAKYQVGEALIRPLFAVAIIHLHSATAESVIAAYVLSGLVILCFQVSGIRRLLLHARRSHSPARVWSDDILRQSWPFATWGVFTWAHLASDRWALSIYAGESAVGCYSALYQLGYYPIVIASGLATQVLQPIIFEVAGLADVEERVASSAKIAKYLAAALLTVAVAAAFIVYCTHKQVVQLLLPAEYHDLSFVLPILIIAGGMFCVGQTLTLPAVASLKTSSLIPIKLGAALAGVICNFIGAASNGVYGVACAAAIWGTLYAVSLILLQRSFATHTETIEHRSCEVRL